MRLEDLDKRLPLIQEANLNGKIILVRFDFITPISVQNMKSP